MRGGDAEKKKRSSLNHQDLHFYFLREISKETFMRKPCAVFPSLFEPQTSSLLDLTRIYTFTLHISLIFRYIHKH